MQQSLWSDPTRGELAYTLIAGVALIGAGLVGTHPAIPGRPDAQRPAVQLTAGSGAGLTDWQDVLATANTNLHTLITAAEAAHAALEQALGTESSGYANLLSNSLTGAATGLQNAFYGGWYGGDDGYVFGLFGGTVTDPNTGISETGSTLQEIQTALAQGDLFTAYSYFDEWSLETLDHTLKSLVNPILNVTSHGVTSPAIPGQALQTLTNLVNELLTYSNLKALGDALLAPQISVTFGLTGDLDTIGTDLAAGDIGQALTAIGKIPTDLVGNLLNGYAPDANPYNGSTETFTGLLNNGSLLEQLLVTWPLQIATALNESATTGSAEAVSAVPDLATLWSDLAGAPLS